MRITQKIINTLVQIRLSDLPVTMSRVILGTWEHWVWGNGTQAIGKWDSSTKRSKVEVRVNSLVKSAFACLCWAGGDSELKCHWTHLCRQDHCSAVWHVPVRGGKGGNTWLCEGKEGRTDLQNHSHFVSYIKEKMRTSKFIKFAYIVLQFIVGREHMGFTQWLPFSLLCKKWNNCR